MKPRIALLALALTLGTAGLAAAQDDVAYQNSLLARPLSAADKAVCDAKAGANNPAAYNACRVTRLFFADINAHQEQGFPPMATIKFATTQVEANQLLDRLSN